MEKGYFITGTDTNVGKTWATIAIMQYFKNRGKSVLGMKPVASGCFMHEGQLKNSDALMIQDHASLLLDYHLINPYAYEQAVSPHIAGVHNPVNFDKLLMGFEQLKNLVEVVVVEGAGGWYSPLHQHHSVSDLAKILNVPVILVVAIRLGCINHASLTQLAINQSGLDFAGWIAVATDPDMLCAEQNILTLKDRMDVPLLGVLPYRKQPDFNFFAEQLILG